MMKRILTGLGTCGLLGVTSGSVHAEDLRAPEASARPYVNLSALPTSDTGRGGKVLHDEASIMTEVPPALPKVRIAKPKARLGGEDESRFALGDRASGLQALGFAAPKKMEAKSGSLPKACVEPDVVVAGSNCCSYKVTDQVAGKTEWYRQPRHAFPGANQAEEEENARNFAGTVRASMPFLLPYSDGNVRPGQGWHYNSGSFHGAVDYGKSSYPDNVDPSFKVHSVADGTVLAVYWDDLFGNIVLIEHKAPNGDRYRTAYIHVRDGFDHDLAKAKAMPLAEGDKFDDKGEPTRKYRYYQYARKNNPSKIQWGTNAQDVLVKKGDKVSAGQHIAWSGNTGYGGAGWGLDEKGNPTNSTVANNHLHFMMTVPHPTAKDEWVQIDPYGVYNKASTDCYDLLDDTAFARMFAPFYPSFHNVPVSYVAEYFGYYPGMGMSLQTLTLHRKDQKVLASGAFQYGLSKDWYARFYMSASDYQYWFDTYHQKGYRPRELSVMVDSAGNPRFSAIWKKRNGEQYVGVHGVDDAGWKAKWDEWVVQKGYRVEDRVGYTAGGKERHAAIFVKDGSDAFYELHNMSASTFQNKFDEYGAKGFRLVSVNVADAGGSASYGGIWRPLPGGWVARHGMTPAQYQDAFEEWTSKGFRLYKIDAYANSGRFAAIFTK